MVDLEISASFLSKCNLILAKRSVSEVLGSMGTDGMVFGRP